MPETSTMDYQTKSTELSVHAEPLTTTRYPVGVRPGEIQSGWLDTIWFLADGNRLGYLDKARKLHLIQRSTGGQPERLMESRTVGLRFWFTDPTGDAVGRVSNADVLLPDLQTAPGAMPLAISDGALLGPILVGTQGGRIYATEGEDLHEIRCEFPRIDALCEGPDSLIWLASGRMIAALTESGGRTGRRCLLPEGAHIDALRADSNARELYYCDRNRNVIGRIRDAETVIEYLLPDGVEPRAFVHYSGGILWFTGRQGRSLFQLRGRRVTEYPCADAQSDLHHLILITGHRKTFWFAEPGRSAISTAHLP